MTLEVYLIRHGESEVNADSYSRRVLCGANTWSELTPLGVAQAKVLGEFFRQGRIEFDAVYSSPAVRAQQTARYCLQEMGYAWPRLRLACEVAELGRGDLEGTLKSEAIPPEARKRITNFWEYKVGNGESQKDVYERASSWINMEIIGNGKERVAVFTHENVIKCLAAGLLGLDKDKVHSMKLENASVTVLKYDNGVWK